MIIKCMICGEDFNRTNRTQKHCRNIKCKRAYEKIKREERKKVKPDNSSIKSVAKAAMECGMSYGMYVGLVLERG